MGKRRKDRIDAEKEVKVEEGGRGGRRRRGVCIGCMLLWEYSAPLLLGLMVNNSLEVITLRTLRSILNRPVRR